MLVFKWEITRVWNESLVNVYQYKRARNHHFLAGNLHQIYGEFTVLKDIYCGILKQLNVYIVRNKFTLSFKEYTPT